MKKSNKIIEVDIDKVGKRFLKYIVKDEKNDCLIWTGCKNKKGYGIINVSRLYGTFLCHRLSWLLKYYSLPSKKYLILHKCDNPSCVNVDHLWKGTAQQNTNDMMKKGRCRSIGHFTSEKNPNTILTKEQVIEIKKLLKQNLPQKDIARPYGVTIYAISDIKRGKSWAHVKLEDENV